MLLECGNDYEWSPLKRGRGGCVERVDVCGRSSYVALSFLETNLYV